MDNVAYASLLAENKKLKAKITKLETRNNRKYQLIETITVEDEDVSAISRTEEPDGTAYNFEKIRIEMNVKAASGSSSLFVTANQKNIFVSSGILTTSGERFAISNCRVENGLLLSDFTGSAKAEGVGTIGLAKYEAADYLDNIQSNSITDIEIFTPVTIPVGSTFKIYGIR